MKKTGVNFHKFSYNTSSLTEYVEQNKGELIHRATFAGKTATIFPHQTGIKYKEAINIIDEQVIFISDTNCGFTPSGATTLSQRIITVGKFRADEEYCGKQLETFWAQSALQAGGTYDQMTFEPAWSDFKADLIAQEVETMLWQSRLSGFTANNLQYFDGFIKILDDSGATVNGNPTGITTVTGITESNVRDIFRGIFKLVPAPIINKPNFAMYCGWDVFRTLICALETANLYHYNGVAAGPYETGELTLPGSGYTVIALHGLNGTNRIFAGIKTNFRIGTDLENEEERFRIWYSEDNDDMRFQVRLKLGTQVQFPNEIVSFKLV